MSGDRAERNAVLWMSFIAVFLSFASMLPLLLNGAALRSWIVRWAPVLADGAFFVAIGIAIATVAIGVAAWRRVQVANA